MRTDKLSYKVIWLQGSWHFLSRPNATFITFYFLETEIGRIEAGDYREKSFFITSHCKCPSIWSQRFILLCKMRSTEFLFRAIFWIWIESLSRYRFWACIESGSKLTNYINFKLQSNLVPRAFPLKVGGAGKSRPSCLQGKSLGNGVDSRVQKLMCWPMVEGTRVKIYFYRFQFDATQPLYELKRHHFLEVCYDV